MFSALPPEGRYEITVELTGFATQLRNNLTFNAGQRAVINVPMKLSTVQETITVAGESPLVQTTIVGSLVDHRPSGVRDPAGAPAQLHAPAVARLQRRAEPARHQRRQRRRRRGVELRHLRRRHQQPLEVAHAAAGAAAGLGRLRARDGEGSAAHHQRLLGGVRRPLGRRRQHDHQERHQLGGRLGVLRMLRPGDLDARPPLARVDVPYNQQQVGGVIGGPLVQDKMFYFGSYEYRRERSEVAISSVASPVPSVETPGRRAPGPPAARLPLQRPSTRWRVRYNMVRWQKDNETGGLSLPGTGYIWDNNVDTVHGMFTTVAFVAVPQRSAGAVLALHRQPRRQARRGEHQPHQLRDQRRQRPGHLGRDPRDHLRPVGHGVAVDGQAHDEGRRVDHLRRDQAAVPAAAERRLPLPRQPGAVPRSVPVRPVVRAGAGSPADVSRRPRC